MLSILWNYLSIPLHLIASYRILLHLIASHYILKSQSFSIDPFLIEQQIWSNKTIDYCRIVLNCLRIALINCNLFQNVFFAFLKYNQIASSNSKTNIFCTTLGWCDIKRRLHRTLFKYIPIAEITSSKLLTLQSLVRQIHYRCSLDRPVRQRSAASAPCPSPYFLFRTPLWVPVWRRKC